MCGIVLLHGPDAYARLPECLRRLKHRGPDDDDIWTGDDIALGFTRLAINGEGVAGRQPYSDGELIGAVNGEIFNHSELASAHELTLSGQCDAHVVVPLLARRGPRVIDDLDGFYAGVIVRRRTREVLCLRDHIGKKPLFVGRSGAERFITSELKALDRIDWFEALPTGTTRIDLETGRVVLLAEHRSVPPQADIVQLMDESVRKRMPRADQPVGMFLSGGLDSSIVAALASRRRGDLVCYTLGGPDSPDRRAVEAVAEALALKEVRVVALPPAGQLPDLLREVVHATESYNPSVVSNGLSTYLLARTARQDGIKVVLTGEGADELFGGYHSFRAEDPWRETRTCLIEDMRFTELRRLDACTMVHGVEARCPFLDRAVRSFSDQLEYSDLYDGEQNKVTLRRRFAGILPAEALRRRKTSFDVGSGIRGQVVDYLRRDGRSEREELLAMWRQRFPFDASNAYFHRYPVFDEAIDRRGTTHR